jgi:hypothetical protein
VAGLGDKFGAAVAEPGVVERCRVGERRREQQERARGRDGG